MKSASKKKKRSVPTGNVYIKATFNNTLVTITDPNGNVIAQSSAGANGLKGARKATPYAAEMAVQHALKKASEYGLQKVVVFVQGGGPGRESAIYALATGQDRLVVIKITDVTRLPHNGPRPRKKRRV